MRIRSDKPAVIDFSVPLAGMKQAEESLQKTASTLARVGFADARDTVDLSAEIVALIEARNDFAVNTKVVRTENQMTKSLLSILG